MNKETAYVIYLSFKEGQWEAYYDYGSRSPAAVQVRGDTPEEALTNLVKTL